MTSKIENLACNKRDFQVRTVGKAVQAADPLWRSAYIGYPLYLRLPGATSLRVRSPWLAANVHKPYLNGVGLLGFDVRSVVVIDTTC